MQPLTKYLLYLNVSLECDFFKFHRGFSIIVFSYFINIIIWLTLVTDNKEVVEIFKKCFHFMAWHFLAPGKSVLWFASITMTKTNTITILMLR